MGLSKLYIIWFWYMQLSIHAVLRVISSHRGSLSPDDIDSLLTFEGTSSISRKTSSERTAGGQLRVHDKSSDLKLLTVSSSLPQKSLLSEGGGMDKAWDGSFMLARRSSHTFATTIPKGGPHRDRTTIEDVEMTDSFQVHTTLVSSGNDGKVADDQGNNMQSMDSAAWSSQGSPIDNVGVSSSSHIHHQQTTPPGPGPLHMAAKYVQLACHCHKYTCTAPILSHLYRSGNLRRLQSLIKQGHDVDMPEQEGRTPLMYW